MQKYPYLIVGGGMTAAAAMSGIREIDPTGGIGLIGSDPDAPYDRPPLSKKLWQGKPLDEIWRKLEGRPADLHLGRAVTKIDPEGKRVVDDRGESFGYERLLLATGGRPRRLPFGDDRIVYFRTLADYRRLRGLAEKGRRFAVIGGGFIGSEIAAALAMNGKEVVMVFPGRHIGERLFPGDLARFVSDYYKQKGVEVLAGSQASALAPRGGQLVLTTSGRGEIAVDGVVAGLGIVPNVELAEAAELKVEDGIVVDELLRSTRPDIYAAGDVAAFHYPSLGKRRRVEHEDNANAMGRLAGRNMAGKSEPYRHLPFFYSDLFELGYEAVGELDPRSDIFADWEEPNKKGVIYYLRDHRVRGVLLWNAWGLIEAARALIAEPGPFASGNLKGRLK
ncbi:MAG: NAD(P)/FAD-dependent oxidoreductase [Opitutaceae bacterium]